ncbi:DUF2147 domain-containing protein [Aquimarina rhabdastrellae]
MTSQSVIGKWKTIDDNTGEAKSIVEIYKDNDGKYYGKILELMNKAEEDKLCTECDGEDYNKPVKGMVIIKALSKDGEEYSGGTITDPKNGKVYRCKIWVDEDDPQRLNVRGYIAFLFRTQQWIKV